jgi:uncharacterized iron-regulated membrane protein
MKTDVRPSPHFAVVSSMLMWAVLMLGACGETRSVTSAIEPGGATATPVGTAASARLQCMIQQEPVTADTVSATLACTVTGAALDQTSFTVAYTSAAPRGQGVAATCGGALHEGTGNCTVTFVEGALASRLGTVAGELLPSHQHLASVTPTPTS